MNALWSVIFPQAQATLIPQGDRNAAQDFPRKAICFIIPYSAQGPADTIGRLIAQKLSAQNGWTIDVDNIAGKGGTLGVRDGLQAPADGYTWILVATTHVINPSLYDNLPFDSIEDFAAVTLMVSMPNILVAHPALPANTLQELVTLARQQPGQLKYASGGIGTPSHLGPELLKTVASVDIAHATYNGHTPAVKAVLNAEAAIMCDAILMALPAVNAGKLKALAVTSARRSSVAPQIPTIAECGFPTFDFSPGIGVLMKAGTPPEIIDKVRTQIATALAAPDVKQQLSANGAEIVASTPAQFSAYIKREIATWAQVIKAAGIRRMPW